MRFPSSPGYGGKSRPSASRPSLMHWIMRAIDCPRKAEKRGNYRTADTGCLRKLLFVDQRAALPVVEVPLARGQPRWIAFDKAALGEPSRGSRGQHEEPGEPQLPRTLLDLV